MSTPNQGPNHGAKTEANIVENLEERHASQQAKKAVRPRRMGHLAIALWALGTILITFALMVLSIAFGGFASSDAMSDPGPSGFASWPIALHLATALPALLLGPVVLIRRKGDRLHKIMGRIWVGLMVTAALASVFIRSPGGGILGSGFSFIHLFTIWTLISVPLGVLAIRRGDVNAHRQAMQGLYLGLCVAGAFTLIPGRLLGNWVFALG
jgi:uncharacterized membrane protein